MLEEFIKKLSKNKEIYLRVKVKPGCSINKTKDILADETIKINIKAKAVNNRANEELIKYLAKEFKISKKNVRIISGNKDKLKLIKLIN